MRVDAGDRRQQLTIARALHDQTLQALASAVLRLRLVRSREDPARAEEDLEKAEQLVRDAVEQLRRLSNDLRAGSGAVEDLRTALAALVERSRVTLEMEPELDAESERHPADAELTEPLVETLRELLLEVRIRGGRTSTLRYVDGPEGELRIEMQAAELSSSDEEAAARLDSILDPARRRLRAFDVALERQGSAVRLVVPEPLVENGRLRRDRARSRNE